MRVVVGGGGPEVSISRARMSAAIVRVRLVEYALRELAYVRVVVVAALKCLSVELE